MCQQEILKLILKRIEKQNDNMNRICYENRCKCNEEFLITKKRKIKTRSEGKLLQYPKSSEISSKIFQIHYYYNLSLTAKFLLNHFHNKYIYYAIDDVLYTLKLKPVERDNLLSLLYSPILSLQNNFAVNFFDIWIREVSIDEISKYNKFLKEDLTSLKSFNSITIKFFYRTRIPEKKQKSLW